MKRVIARSRAKCLPTNNIVCLSIDRLNADALGAYGSTLVETPAFDSLAAESIVFDNYFVNTLDLGALFRSLWLGERPDATNDESARARDGDPDARPKSLFRILKERGYRVYVVSDVENVALNPCVESDFCDGRFLLGDEKKSTPAESIAETDFARNFEELAKFLLQLQDESKYEPAAPFFVWAHFSGWNDRWDFPIETRKSFQECEDDPEPYAAVAPPFWKRDRELSARKNIKRAKEDQSDESVQTTNDDDPVAARERARLDALDPSDRRQSVVETYCAGVVAFNQTLAAFLAILKERGVLDRTLFALLGARGCGLGAPSCLGVPTGNQRADFYTEELRAPLLIRLPDRTGATYRLAALCDPRDVFATIVSWFEFAPILTSDDFWKYERVEISPFAGKWLAEPSEENASEEKNGAIERALENPDEGKNLLEFLRDEDGDARDYVVAVAKDGSSEERAVVAKNRVLKINPREEENQENNEALDENAERAQLFVMPDDRFCVNDVAEREIDVVEELTRLAYRDQKER